MNFKDLGVYSDSKSKSAQIWSEAFRAEWFRMADFDHALKTPSIPI